MWTRRQELESVLIPVPPHYPWPAVTAFAMALAIVTVAGSEAASGAAERRVSFRADDGVLLAAGWHEPSVRPAPAVILVHMLGRSRRDWDLAATRLAGAGIGALTLDLRGHGESGYVPRPESPSDFTAMVADLTAARRYLATRVEVEPGRIGLAGASLGGSLAVLAAAEGAGVASLAILSPSLDYRGVRIEAAARKVTRPMLLVASDEDGYALRSARDLQKAAGGVREVVTLEQAGHGTVMLGREPSLTWTLVDWFRRTL
jgi:pimeloyl-ACP methyl ester carboxylesterase